jgi:hypothetical protein
MESESENPRKKLKADHRIIVNSVALARIRNKSISQSREIKRLKRELELLREEVKSPLPQSSIDVSENSGDQLTGVIKQRDVIFLKAEIDDNSQITVKYTTDRPEGHLGSNAQGDLLLHMIWC